MIFYKVIHAKFKQKTRLTPSVQRAVRQEVGGHRDLAAVRRLVLGRLARLVGGGVGGEHLGQQRGGVVVDLAQGGGEAGGVGEEGQAGIVVSGVALEQLLHPRLCGCVR